MNFQKLCVAKNRNEALLLVIKSVLKHLRCWSTNGFPSKRRRAAMTRNVQMPLKQIRNGQATYYTTSTTAIVPQNRFLDFHCLRLCCEFRRQKFVASPVAFEVRCKHCL